MNSNGERKRTVVLAVLGVLTAIVGLVSASMGLFQKQQPTFSNTTNGPGGHIVIGNENVIGR